MLLSKVERKCNERKDAISEFFQLFIDGISHLGANVITMSVKMRERNPQKSKQDILSAAEILFAGKGIYGTRVDEIAHEAGINKRMNYEYFGSKEELYKAVLVEVYGRLGYKEVDILSDKTDPVDAIRKLIQFYFKFLKENNTYVKLLQWENLNEGKYIEDEGFTGIKDPTLELLRKIINKGKEDGIFHSQVDTEQVILSLLTFIFAYFSNRFTLSKLFGKRLDNDDNINKRIEHVTDMFLCYLLKE
ncbi:TetR/AcrR family transcriptional regulator [Anaerocolumna sp.]|uniref:TetR/AcrR family transcriptional regulator n=1 Tax=Anaerocolumna sp. TaxID=2041569 RepID=UPI0028A9B5AC|nr:TetR/AcrR family transcriptional regulator [Anaerocolumna sp.]